MTAYKWETLLSRMTIPELVQFTVCPLYDQEKLEHRLAVKYGLRMELEAEFAEMMKKELQDEITELTKKTE